MTTDLRDRTDRWDPDNNTRTVQLDKYVYGRDSNDIT